MNARHGQALVNILNRNYGLGSSPLNIIRKHERHIENLQKLKNFLAPSSIIVPHVNRQINSERNFIRKARNMVANDTINSFLEIKHKHLPLIENANEGTFNHGQKIHSYALEARRFLLKEVRRYPFLIDNERVMEILGQIDMALERPLPPRPRRQPSFHTRTRMEYTGRRVRSPLRKIKIVRSKSSSPRRTYRRLKLPRSA